MAVGDTTFASVVEPGVAFWNGIVTRSATNEITLTTPEETKGTFGAGTKEIMAGKPSSKDMFEEDIAGAIVTGGTSTAYTVASYRVYDSLARLNGNIIAFSPHVINGATVTLNVDGLGAKPLRRAPSVELQSNSLIAGVPYTALYNNSDQVFYLHAFGDAPGIPIGASLDFWGLTTPSSHFAFPTGQQLSQAAFPALYAMFGPNRYGADSGGNFFLPDRRGRVSAMIESSATRLTSSFFGGNSTLLGATGGTESVTLSTGQIPAHSHANTLNDPGHSHTSDGERRNGSVSDLTPGSVLGTGNGITINSNTTGVTITNVNAGGGGAHSSVQHTICCNVIIRVL
jgi:microcystin-dependent protein